MPVRPGLRSPFLLLAASIGLACSDGAGPKVDLAIGTFSVAPMDFGIQTVGPCVVPAFEFTLERDNGVTSVLLPDSLYYDCASQLFMVPLYPVNPAQVGDSLELIWTHFAPPDDTGRTLVLRWKPGGTNLQGPAILNVSDVLGAVEVPWTGTRQ